MSFYYHATLEEFLPSIAKQGLLPHDHEWFDEPVIFMGDDLNEVSPYRTEKSSAVLRLFLPFDLVEDGETSELVHYETVPPTQIDLLVRGRWVPLLEVYP
jgi:hypothetical protein